MAVKKVPSELTCLSCGEILKSMDFYISNSPMYKSNIAEGKGEQPKMPICKTCLARRFNDILKVVKIPEMAVFHMCATLDVPFKSSAFEMAEKQKAKFDFGVYMQKINSRKEYKTLTFLDSDNISHVLAGDKEISKYRLEWGDGFSLEEYKAMEHRFNTLVEERGCADFVQADKYRKFVRASMVYDRDMGSDESKDRNSASQVYFRALKESGLGGTETKIDTEKSAGELIAEFEKHSPIVEDERYKDIQGMLEVKNDIIKHMKRTIGRD